MAIRAHRIVQVDEAEIAVGDPAALAPVLPIHPKKRRNQSGGANRRAIQAAPQSTLWYGDNLQVLREHIPSESVDLVYLDPPFNSNRAYNIIFRGPKGLDAPSQIQAFEDTWTWTEETNHALADLAHSSIHVHRLVAGLVDALDRTDLSAYIVMMTVRLVELHRVLRATGTLYLHCDPTASHYLKIVLDVIFGPRNFRNEIIWRRTRAHNDKNLRKFGSIHDTILVFSKTHEWIFNRTTIERSQNASKTHDLYRHSDGNLYRKGDCRAPGDRGPKYEWNGHFQHWRFTEESARELEAAGRIVFTKSGMPRVLRPVAEQLGTALQDVWVDIDPPNSGSGESQGFATQKPEALLERIIRSSSNPGDVVLDPFCGCGTAIVAAEKLNRRWIGIDVTSLAIGVIERRFDEMFEDAQFAVNGVPDSLDDAADLANRDPFQFQWWAASRVGAVPHDGRNKKGADKGIDGIIPFFDDNSGRAKRCIISVKSGRNVHAGDVRDLLGTVEANRAEAGTLITLQPPTGPMRAAAAQAGLYESPLGHDYPRIQILTIEDILADRLPDLPDQESQRRRSRRIAAQRYGQQRLPV